MDAASYNNNQKCLMEDDDRWYRALAPTGRLPFIPQRDADCGSKSVLAGFKRFEARLDRSILSATQEPRRCRADRRAQTDQAQVQNQNQTQPTRPTPKIISIHTLQPPPPPITPPPQPPTSDHPPS